MFQPTAPKPSGQIKDRRELAVKYNQAYDVKWNSTELWFMHWLINGVFVTELYTVD